MRKYLKLAIVIFAFLAVTLGAFILAESITENEALRDLIKKLGIFGIVFVGLLGGLNAFVPVPPATFAPLFLEAGMSELFIVIGFAVGTYIADSTGFLLGWLGSSYATSNYPKVTNRLRSFMEKHQRYIPFTIFGFIVLAPLPNETILIPLAIMGYKYKKLILPLIIGNLMHHTLMVLGYSTFFDWVF